MKCSECGASIELGWHKCEYCGHLLNITPKAAPGAGAGAQGVAPGGSTPDGGATAVRALSSDGCWYCCYILESRGDQKKIRWQDGREAELPAEMVREPASPHQLTVGTPVLGEYEGRYYPGTIRQVGDNQWNVQFDDGESAMMPADRISLWTLQLAPVNPGQQVLAQQEDGCWYPGRIVSGPDGRGYQRVRLDAGGEAMLSHRQINGPAGPDLLQKGRKVMGIGEDGCWYPGTVQDAKPGQANIKFDDGDEAWIFAHEVRFIC